MPHQEPRLQHGCSVTRGLKCSHRTPRGFFLGRVFRTELFKIVLKDISAAKESGMPLFPTTSINLLIISNKMCTTSASGQGPFVETMVVDMLCNKDTSEKGLCICGSMNLNLNLPFYCIHYYV